MPLPVRLRSTDENVAEIAALADLLGGAAGLDGLLDDLKYQARRVLLPRLLGRAVSSAVAFDDYDQRDLRWWPQGLSTSADSCDEEVVGGGRRVIVTTWYAKPVDGVEMGSRLTFLDLDTLRYRHVLLVEPRLGPDGRLSLSPVRIHAGGVVWCGPWLHVAATGRGFVTCRVDDIMRVEDDNAVAEQFGVLDDGRVASYGHHYVLPVRMAYRAFAEDPSVRLRYSFLSLDRSARPPVLVAGEYGRGRASTRLARYELDPETLLLSTGDRGWSWPVALEDGGVPHMQGAALAGGRYHVTVSRGAWTSGSVYVGRPGELTPHLFAVPMGPEDLSYWPSTDTLWTLTEHPRRRWVCVMRRSWFDRERRPLVPRMLPRRMRAWAQARLVPGRSGGR